MNLKYQPEHYVAAMRIGMGATILGVFSGVFGLISWWWVIGMWLVYCFMAMVNSAGFHRLFSHRAYSTTPFWEWFLLICGTLSCYGSSIQWTVHHTQHHLHSDTERDPHKFDQFKDIFRSNYQIYQLDFAALRAAKHLLKKPGHKWVHEHYWTIPGTFFLILSLLSLKAALFLYLAPIGLVIFSAALFNHVAHDENGPNNKGWWTLQSSGEYRHRLHHEKPGLWDLREEWYDVDPSAMFISWIKTGEGSWD